MKLKYRLAIVALATLVVFAYAIHSQIAPKPLTPFVVNSVMSSPLSNGKTQTENFSTAVRNDGLWVEIRVDRRGHQEFIALRLGSSHLRRESRENHLFLRDVHSVENTSKR